MGSGFVALQAVVVFELALHTLSECFFVHRLGIENLFMHLMLDTPGVYNFDRIGIETMTLVMPGTPSMLIGFSTVFMLQHICDGGMVSRMFLVVLINLCLIPSCKAFGFCLSGYHL